MNYKTAAILLLGNISLLGYLAYSGPYELRVNTEGQVIGFGGKLKEFAQGKGFWDKQLRLVEREIAWESSQPERDAQLKAGLNKIVDDTELLLADLHSKYPPEPMTQSEALRAEAEELNGQADALERAEINKLLESHRLGRLAELRKIREAIKQVIRTLESNRIYQ
ncbi:hypothetical protein [Vibrio sp. MEBiC08052]|uniref:hypothetical protein n=1 Tax=Vibrio sp. MEBiC08052 TaxID=1761910 RepID=UPI00074079FA|nr:hypothetical protein [Vibrio sp. MEBiC08052]KUJ00571.1 hypothetical protein VRK_00730 [Vibrio sp. MEBiC08052]